jgi:L-threonylcarbamoyladenylate synthase
MHPEVQQDHPGACPKCGMALEPKTATAASGDEESAELRDMTNRFWIGAALTVLDGGICDVGIESAIVDCTRAQPALLRPGQLGRARLEAVLGRPLAAPDAASPRASGTLASHYAPRATVRLFDARQPPWETAPEEARAAECIAVYSRAVPAAAVLDAGWQHRPMPAQPAAVAHELFAVLREFDAVGVSAIWVQRPPPGPAWDGVRDRLQRAAA